MSENGITPGPWEWTPEEEGDGWGPAGPELRSVPLGKIWDEYWAAHAERTSEDFENAPPLGDVCIAWGYDGWGITVSEADKHVIAAAWEMLVALRARIQGAPNADELALAAIAKAEGRG